MEVAFLPERVLSSSLSLVPSSFKFLFGYEGGQGSRGFKFLGVCQGLRVFSKFRGCSFAFIWEFPKIGENNKMP